MSATSSEPDILLSRRLIVDEGAEVMANVPDDSTGVHEEARDKESLRDNPPVTETSTASHEMQGRLLHASTIDRATRVCLPPPIISVGDPCDYEHIFPEDPMYHELDENACVWRVYMEEAAEFDADMFVKAADGLDALLVFAGLFSAVLTTFVVQTSQALSTDAVSASLLTELVAIQRAIAGGTSGL
ncbi:hypothetical protein PC9H_002255 [Pleurotus ostreatus]|uniref:DUF6535 domain-containing protein n=1 Tax=Pleurotus ostreatus TaxID=5322 RepID=A0A8H7DP18_PLEOS|nr:uncharacterized protein PC9H_002255 [Pleurotus ostreatus]KAF7419663.1 hypothetical protein PC9H_002255 [Pleurotus ostreatus]